MADTKLSALPDGTATVAATDKAPFVHSPGGVPVDQIAAWSTIFALARTSALDAAYVLKAGDTMTGTLNVGANAFVNVNGIASFKYTADNTLAALTLQGVGQADDFTKPGILNVKGTGAQTIFQVQEFQDGGAHQFTYLNFRGKNQNLGSWNFIDYTGPTRFGIVQFSQDGTNFNTFFNGDSGRGAAVIVTGPITGSDITASGVLSGASLSSDGGGVVTDGASNMTVSGNLGVGGDLNVTGAKSFSIPHPVVKGKTLKHAAIEAPRPDLIYRGEAKLFQGATTVYFDQESGLTDGTFEALVKKNAQAFLQNKTGFAAVRPSWIGDSAMRIECEDPDSTDIVNWLIVVERKLDFKAEV
jgi:hypothetical protein